MRLLTIGLFAVVVLSLAACGGGSETPAAASGAAPLSAPALPQASAADTTRLLRNMRAVHMMGNWSGNTLGIKRASPGPLGNGGVLAAVQVTAVVNRGSFMRGTVLVTNDNAVITLTNATLAGKTYARAGFWLVRSVDSGEVFLQFLPSLDTSLAGISGFAGDVTLTLSADGSNFNTFAAQSLTGEARSYVAAVLASAPQLLAAASFSQSGGATFDKAAAIAAATSMRAQASPSLEPYFAFLTQQNVNWIGISVAMFIDNLGSPDVKLRYRATSVNDGTIYTFDDADLEAFIRAARARGFHVYLTLAFEPSGVNLPPSLADPTCNTNAYQVNRNLFGQPSLETNNAYQACIDPAKWWWAPSHPDHARNVARFWSTYTEVATRYARFSQAWGVEMFSLGTETEKLFRTRPSGTWTNHFKPELQAMVASVRSVYSGVLTYDQSYDYLQAPQSYQGALGSAFLFDDLALDAIGISAYFRLATGPVSRVMAVSELEAAWQPIFSGPLVDIRLKNPGKPMMFLEVGYTDSVNSVFASVSEEGATITGRDASGVTDGMRQQQNILQALFNVNARNGYPLAGMFLWDNGIFMDSVASLCGVVNFAQYCRPSAATVSAAYAAVRNIDADRVFNWAERTFPQLFPAQAASFTTSGYWLRYYPASGTYLGTKDGRIYLHNGAQYNLEDVGSVDGFIAGAAAAGF